MTAAFGLGVPQLERLLEPVPPRSTLAFVSEPGIEAEAFLYMATHGALRQGRDVVYAVTNRSPQSVRKALHDHGLEGGPGPSLHFVDAYSALLGSQSDARWRVEDPSSAEAFAAALEEAAAEHPDAVLVVDSLSSLVDNGTPAGFLASAGRIERAMRRFAFTAAVFTKWPYPDEVLGVVDRFDAVVAIRAVEDRVAVSQYFRLVRARWKDDPETRPRLYKSVKPGGVLVFVPKIVVTGPYNAGKSSFVHSVSDEATSADRLGTTVALDHGRATMDGLTADVFGTPGQARFDPILKVVAGQAVGVVVVVDSTKPDSFPRAREMMDLTWRQGLPAIVAANKQDAPDALDPAEVARLLAPPPGVAVVGCVASEPASTRRVLRALIEHILSGRDAR